MLTVTDQFEKMLLRIKELADMPMESLHAANPDITEKTLASTVATSRAMGYSRGDLMNTILQDEFRRAFKKFEGFNEL